VHAPAAGAEKMMLTVAFEAACFSRLAPLPRIRSYSRSDLVHDWACSVKDTWAKNKMKSLAGWILFSLRPHTQPASQPPPFIIIISLGLFSAKKKMEKCFLRARD
jgi:hypothetical protein